MRPARRFSWWWVPLCIGLVGCGSAGSALDTLDTVHSWAATVHMVGVAWQRGAVPRAYATQTLGTAQDELGAAVAPLHQVRAFSPDQQATLDQALSQLLQTVTQMQAAVERGDHAALAQQLGQLDAARATTDTLRQAIGGAP